MDLRRRTGVDVKVDSQPCEGILHYLVVLVHNVLGSYALVLCLDGDGHAVLVTSADKHHILSAHPEIAHVNVSGNVCSGKMADMHRTICVGERAGN